MGLLGVIGGAVSDFAGGAWDLLGWDTGSSGGGTSSPGGYPAVDYSAAMMYASDNNKTTALAQIQAGEFAMQQATVDRQMQLAANLELGLERLDTNLQMGKLQFIQQMTAEQNRHAEKIAEAGLNLRRLARNDVRPEADIPEPEMES